MTKKVYVTPGGLTILQAKAGLIVAVLFLLFGLVFAVVVVLDTPSSEGGLIILQIAFFLIWVAACLSIIVFCARLLSKGKTVAQNSLIDMYLAETTGPPTPGTADFEARLHQLERLRKDGLITEAEYQDKREQILQEKW
jgi:hypothetical protein